jgi:hypothetical protein
LENAIEPYRQSGYVITSQTDSAIMLRAPAPNFSWGMFAIGLFLLWPVAIYYWLRFNHSKERNVCVRITSQEEIEATGFTLDLLEREQQRQLSSKRLYTVIFLLVLLIIGGVLLFIVIRELAKS